MIDLNTERVYTKGEVRFISDRGQVEMQLPGTYKTIKFTVAAAEELQGSLNSNTKFARLLAEREDIHAAVKESEASDSGAEAVGAQSA